MWLFLAETAHVGEWDRTSSTKSTGGGIIRMSTKMKQGVPKTFATSAGSLRSSWVFGSLTTRGSRSLGHKVRAFHLDSPDQTTVKLPFRFGFV